jgi:hypothetical protein
MAPAVDWLDAYRAGRYRMFAWMRTPYLRCGGSKTIIGREGLRAYWVDHLRQYPASELDDLRLSHAGTTISYITSTGVVSAVLSFNSSGRVRSSNVRGITSKDTMVRAFTVWVGAAKATLLRRRLTAVLQSAEIV